MRQSNRMLLQDGTPFPKLRRLSVKIGPKSWNRNQVTESDKALAESLFASMGQPGSVELVEVRALLRRLQLDKRTYFSVLSHIKTRLQPFTGAGQHLDMRALTFVAASGAMSPIGHPCRYCGAPAQTIDHVWPRSRGGDDHPNNLVPACQPCNAVKHSRSILPDACQGCGQIRHPGDVDTATGQAFYSCRCGRSWVTYWDLQLVPFSTRA